MNFIAAERKHDRQPAETHLPLCSVVAGRWQHGLGFSSKNLSVKLERHANTQGCPGRWKFAMGESLFLREEQRCGGHRRSEGTG